MRTAVASVVAAALIGSGCASSSDTNSQMVRTGTPKTTVGANGKLRVTPAPLTLQDVDDQPAGGRRAIVAELFWAQWGSWPDVVDAYAPAVRSRVGRESITAAYAVLRPQLAASRPRIVSSRLARGQATVRVELLSTTSPASPESFVLRRFGKRWLIVSDTLLERGLESLAP